jgi:hypothetical protein
MNTGWNLHEMPFRFIGEKHLARGCGMKLYGVRDRGQTFEALTCSTPIPVEDGTEAPVWVTLRDEEAQSLMDALWNTGVRPSNGEGSVGQLAATEAHLADMRALVFKTGMPK